MFFLFLYFFRVLYTLYNNIISCISSATTANRMQMAKKIRELFRKAYHYIYMFCPWNQQVNSKKQELPLRIEVRRDSDITTIDLARQHPGLRLAVNCVSCCRDHIADGGKGCEMQTVFFCQDFLLEERVLELPWVWVWFEMCGIASDSTGTASADPIVLGRGLRLVCSAVVVIGLMKPAKTYIAEIAPIPVDRY